MHDTRTHMSDQMHALEDKVTGMAQDAADAVDNAVSGARDAVSTASEWVQIAQSRPRVRQPFFGRTRHVRRYPWLAVGGMVALGFVCARFVGRR